MNTSEFDVMVIGGGPAGICAAVQAGRAGARTVLVEKNGIPGGALTFCGINYPGIFDAWGKQVIAGIGWDLVCKTLAEEGRTPPDFSKFKGTESHCEHHIRVNALLFAAFADEFLLEAGVELKFHTMPGKIVREKDLWRITLCDKDGLYETTAKIVIDCTGDANAVRQAGYAVREPLPCQPGTLSVYAMGYDHSAPQDIPALSEAFEKAAANGEIRPEDIGWGKGYDPRFLWARGGNCNHIPGINAADSEGRTRMELEGRKSILRVYRFLHRQKGLEHLEFLLNTGECGVRETRTIVGEHTITAEDYVSGKCYPDALCYSFYPIDLHDAEVGLDCRQQAPGTFPTVSRGSMIPENSKGFLAAGRIISSDRLANSALRVQATAFATGQAAGAMGALAVRNGCEPGELDLAEIHRLLRDNRAIIPGEIET